MLDRRSFLKRAAALALVATPGFAHAAPQIAATSPLPTTAGREWRGVNLGGWLVLEKWLTPSLFAGTDAADEYQFCHQFGKAAAARLRAHRDSFITDKDFLWLARHGVGGVRLPVGYWLFGDEPPYVGALETVDRAFDQAGRHGLGVLLDLHGAPGSQNGWDHSGRQGSIDWPKPENVARTVQFLERLAERYGTKNNLLGIELLNEPRWDVPLDVLKQFYQDASQRVRPHIKPTAAIVIHDGFRPFAWSGFMQEPEYKNIVLDTHIYQCYVDEDKRRTIYEHVQKAVIDRKKQLADMQKQLPVIVGEWSVALDSRSLTGLSRFAAETGKRAYGDAQLLSNETSTGWFFWTYKTENSPEWSFRDCVERGWLPGRFDAAPG